MSDCGCNLLLRTVGCLLPLILLLQAGVGSQQRKHLCTEPVKPHRSQEGAGGQGQDSGHDSLFSCFCLHTFRRPLLRKFPRPGHQPRSQMLSNPQPAPRLSSLCPDPLLKRVPSPEILKLGLWASRQLKTEGRKDLHMICFYHYLFYETLKKKFKNIYYTKSFNNNKQPMTS